MRVFITGCESFIGKVLRQQLGDAGHAVSGTDVAPSAWGPGHPYDVRSLLLATAVPPESVIIHLAALSTDKLCKADPITALDVNVGGTINVAKAALAKKCSQVIFASSEWVYGESPANLPMHTEGMAPNPQGVYAWSKLLAEQALQVSGLPNVAILRFGITYGPRDKNWSAVEALTDKVMKGEDVTVGSLRTARRFIHVRDLCAGIMAALGRTGVETFNLAGEQRITLCDILETAQAITGNRVSIVENAPGQLSVRDPISLKALAQLHWRPRITLYAGIEDVVNYLRARK